MTINDFWLGALYPLTTLEDALAILALGMLAGQSQKSVSLKVALTFSIALAFGAFIAMYLVERPWIGWSNLASLLVLGAMVALALRVPRLVLIMLAAVFGAAHGVSDGMEIFDPTNPWLFIPGLAFTGFVTTYCTILIVAKLKPWWTLIAIRVLGSWIAAVALLIVALDSLKPDAV